jgi:hypothetical protein
MQRTAEEFVHELPRGRWFVGDFVRTGSDGQAIFLIELRAEACAIELSIEQVTRARSSVRTYSTKSSAKRAAQRMIERVLDEDRRGAK